MTKPTLISTSEVGMYASCAQKYYLAMIMRREARQQNTDASDMGTALHAVLDHHAKHGEWTLPAATRALGMDDALLLIGVAMAYRQRYANEPLVRAFSEQEFGIDLTPELRFVGAFDGIIAEGRRRVVVDLKTTSSDIDPGGTWWDRRAINHQRDWYILAQRLMGHDCDTFITDAVRIPKLTRNRTTPVNAREFYVRAGKWGKAGDPKPGTFLEDEGAPQFAQRVRDTMLASPEQYFQRRRDERTEADLEKSAADLDQYLRLIQLSTAEDLWPRNPASCLAYGPKYACGYIPVCRGEAGIADDNLYQLKAPRYRV